MSEGDEPQTEREKAIRRTGQVRAGLVGGAVVASLSVGGVLAANALHATTTTGSSTSTTQSTTGSTTGPTTGFTASERDDDEGGSSTSTTSTGSQGLVGSGSTGTSSQATTAGS